MFGILLLRRTSSSWSAFSPFFSVGMASFRAYFHGSVKSFNNKKGFGFIHPELELQNDIIDHYGSWKDVFIHYTDIDDEVRLLIPTTKVEFDCEFEEGGPVARNVRKIIPKKKKMVIERWLNAPDGLDDLVKRKESMSSSQWTSHLRTFYGEIALKTNALYSADRIKYPGEQKNHLEYITMANDLIAGLEQPAVYDKIQENE